MAISSRRQRLVVLELGAQPRVGFQGGIDRSSVTSGDVVTPLPGLLVGLQGERPDLVPAVAVLALLLEDRGDVLGVRRGISGDGNWWRNAASLFTRDLASRRLFPTCGLLAKHRGGHAERKANDPQSDNHGRAAPGCLLARVMMSLLDRGV